MKGDRQAPSLPIFFFENSRAREAHAHFEHVPQRNFRKRHCRVLPRNISSARL
jgi:hypothetical protein